MTIITTIIAPTETFSTYATFGTRPSDQANIAERRAVYGAVSATETARDPRCRAAAFAAHERAEIERSRKANAGRVSSFWAKQQATPAA